MSQDLPLALSYDDVLLVPQFSEIGSRSEVDLSTQLTPKVKLKLPLIPSNMSDVTGVEMATAIRKLGGLGVIPRFMTQEEQVEKVKRVVDEVDVVGSAVGCRNGALERAELLVKAGSVILFLDVAHGHMKKAVEMTKKLKDRFGNSVDIVSGNVATYEGAEALFKAGADSVKVGIGPGSICTTRIETGSGVPQITAVMEASRAAKKHKKTIICDGGTKSSGDIVKGLAAGASAIMAGNQFAGTDEAPGKLVELNGIKYKNYNASTSVTEKKNHLKKNGEELSKNYVKQIEGVESVVPYKGPLKDIVDNMAANIRSGLSYSGAKNIEELWKKAKFVRITSQGMRESSTHDVIVNEIK